MYHDWILDMTSKAWNFTCRCITFLSSVKCNCYIWCWWLWLELVCQYLVWFFFFEKVEHKLLLFVTVASFIIVDVMLSPFNHYILSCRLVLSQLEVEKGDDIRGPLQLVGWVSSWDQVRSDNIKKRLVDASWCGGYTAVSEVGKSELWSWILPFLFF